MRYSLYLLLLNLGLLCGMLLLFVAGRRIGARDLARDPEGARTGFGALEASVLALLGLVLAFTIAGAGARFDRRRAEIVDEANAIGTAYLRLALLPPAAQPALKAAFGRYLDTRLAVYRKIPDLAAVQRELATGNAQQEEIWRLAVAAVRADDAPPSAAMLLLPALNAMFDIAATRAMSPRIHTPLGIFVVLFVLALVGALLSGYGMAGGRSGSWLHIVCFVLVVVATISVILDLEFPRLGLVRIEVFDQTLADLRQKMP